MTDTVYVLGAGLNQAVKDWHSLSPPMLRNFFQIILKHPLLSNEHNLGDLKPLFDYIEKYWKKSRPYLETSEFDLEECFTMLASQLQDALNSKDESRARELASIEFMLKSLLAQVLSEFQNFSVQSDVMRAFGDILYSEKPTLITFNYDTITEAVIENASGLRGRYPESLFLTPNLKREVSDEEVSFSHHKWNRPLGYGLKFDLVQLHRAGISSYVDGNRFYSNPQNRLYERPILKLHGSLNWFRILPFRLFPTIGEKEVRQPKWMEDAIIHVEGHWWLRMPPDFDGWVIAPIIITPVLNKESLFDDPIYKRAFAPLWNRALDALSKCKRLVVIGYSFSPTDFRTRKLFLEAFATNKLDELIVVNPNRLAKERAAEFCHFNNPTVYSDLKSFVSSIQEINPQKYSGYKFDEELFPKFEEGRRILKFLDDSHIEVSSAFWLYLPSPTGWRMFLASPLVNSEGEEQVLARIISASSTMIPPSKLEAGEIILVSPSSPVIAVLKRMIRTGSQIGGLRLTGSVVDNFKIEDAYIYRMQ